MRVLSIVALAVPLLASEAPATTPSIVESKFELFVADVAESIRFYRTLGFEVAHQKPDGYATLTCGPTVVALAPLPGWLPLHWLGFLRRPPLGTEIVFYSSALEEARAALEAAGYEPGPIALQPWGLQDFRITDYDGYYIRISEGRAVPE